MEAGASDSSWIIGGVGLCSKLKLRATAAGSTQSYSLGEGLRSANGATRKLLEASASMQQLNLVTAHRHLLQRDPIAKTEGQAEIRPPTQWGVLAMWAAFGVATIIALRPDPAELSPRTGIPAHIIGFYVGDDNSPFEHLTVGRGGVAFDRVIMVPSESVYESRDGGTFAMVDSNGMWYFLTPSGSSHLIAQRGTPGDRRPMGTYRRLP